MYRLSYKGAHMSKRKWKTLVAACGGGCLMCGTTANLTKDHIIPVSAGGRGDLENLQPLCGRCNSEKGTEVPDLRPEDWREKYKKIWKGERP